MNRIATKAISVLTATALCFSMTFGAAVPAFADEAASQGADEGVDSLMGEACSAGDAASDGSDIAGGAVPSEFDPDAETASAASDGLPDESEIVTSEDAVFEGDDQGIAIPTGHVAAVSSGTTVSGKWEYYEDTSYFKEGGITVCGYTGSLSGGNLTIPAKIDGKRVDCVNLCNMHSDNKDLCLSVTSVTLPSSLRAIGSRCFQSFSSLKTVNIPSGSQLELMGEQCFEGCTSLESFTMPSKLKTIKDSPFYGCTSLKKVVFNDIVEPFEYTRTVLSGGDSFEVPRHFNPAPYAEDVSYVVPSTCKNFKLVDGSLMSKDGTILYAHPGTFQDGSYSVSAGVKTIGWMAFFSNDHLEHLTLPGSLTAIEEYAFAYTPLQELTIPDSVTEVYGNICTGCTSLKKAVIGNGVKELGKCAGWEDFYGCTSLADVTLGSSLEVIGNSCFADCPITTIHLPKSLKQINYAAFGRCTKLKKVTGGEGLQSIYNMAFLNTTSLGSFPMSSGDTHYKIISGTAFQGSSYTPEYPSNMEVNGEGDYVAYDATLDVDGTELYSEAYKVLDLVNQQRKAAGLSEVTMDKDLLKAAMQRAAELAVRFDHSRPDGEECFSVSSKARAENIAAGQGSAASVMDSWMNSSGHKANILGSSYTTIGIGAVKHNGTVRWVQIFGTGDADKTSKPADADATFKIKMMDSEWHPEMSLAKSGSSYSLAITNSGFGTCIVANSCVKWSSADESVVTVGSKGKVKLVGPGSTTITASADKTTRFYRAQAQVEGKASAQAVENGTYKLVPAAAKKLSVGVKGASKKAGANVQLAKKTKAKSGKWKIAYDSKTGAYKVTNAKSGKVLGVKGKAKKGANVVQRKDSGKKQQRWTIEKTSGGYVLRNAANQKLALTVSGKAKKGANVKLAKLSSGSKAQTFKLK